MVNSFLEDTFYVVHHYIDHLASENIFWLLLPVYFR